MGLDDVFQLATRPHIARIHRLVSSKLTSCDYFMPVRGIILLRHAANRFAASSSQSEEDLASE
jgi:hypothetical protein